MYRRALASVHGSSSDTAEVHYSLIRVWAPERPPFLPAINFLSFYLAPHRRTSDVAAAAAWSRVKPEGRDRMHKQRQMLLRMLLPLPGAERSAATTDLR